MTGGEITEQDGVTTIDVPNPENVSPVDKLTGDSDFMQKYMSGDAHAVATMGNAIKSNGPALTPAEPASAVQEFSRAAEGGYQEQPDQPNDGEYHSSDDFQLDFAGVDVDVTTMGEINQSVNEMIYSLQAPREIVQPIFNRMLEVSKEYGSDPEANAEERHMALDKQLRTSWGEQYEAKMSAVLGLLEQHEELDTALYESGSWGDFWTLDTLSRVALKEF